MVEEAFKYAQETKTPLCAFLGDDCVTLHMTDELLVGACAADTMLLPPDRLVLGSWTMILVSLCGQHPCYRPLSACAAKRGCQVYMLH